MNRLFFRLAALILCLYVAGTVYPFLTTVSAHSPSPSSTPSAPPPTPPPSAPPVPSAPAQLDSRTAPPPPPPSSDLGGGGCQGAAPHTRALGQAVYEQETWRQTDFDAKADALIGNVRRHAAYIMADTNRDIRRAQEAWHLADIEVNKYQDKKNQGTLVHEDLLTMAQEDRQEKWEELQWQKGRLQKVEAWADKKVAEIRALATRAKNGDYNGYRGLENFDWSSNPSSFK
jgi:hypothetical protein